MVASGIGMALAILAASAPGAQADPAVYLQAFNETCRKDFPNLDAIAAEAVRQGWRETSIRPVGDTRGAAMPALPRVFMRDGLMLFLAQGGAALYDATCQVTGSAATRLKGADIIALASPSLGSALALDQGKDRDGAIWTVAPGITISAGVSIYRKMRAISFMIRRAR